MELLLRWDVCDHEGYNIQMLHVSGRVGHALFPGRLTLMCDNDLFIMSMAKPARPDASKHGLYVRMESERSK